MPSTVIKRFDYLADSRELVVTFVTGRRYLYSDVPQDAVKRFAAASSRGAYFNRHIRDHYKYRELAAADADDVKSS